MHPKDIVIGETYLFIATLNPQRKHLEGQPFTVVRKERVFRKVPYRRGKHNAGTRKVLRFFNDDGVGARADELGELPNGWKKFNLSSVDVHLLEHNKTDEARILNTFNVPPELFGIEKTPENNPE